MKIQSRDDLLFLLTQEAGMTSGEAVEAADLLSSKEASRLAKFAVIAGRLRVGPKRAAAIIAELEKLAPPTPAFDMKAASEVNALAKRVVAAEASRETIAQWPLIAAVLAANADLHAAEAAMVRIVGSADVAKLAASDAKAGPLADGFRAVQVARMRLNQATRAWSDGGAPGLDRNRGPG